MPHMQQGQHTFCKPQSFVSWEAHNLFTSQHRLQQEDNPFYDINIKLLCAHIFGFSEMRMFETTRECTLTKDLVCSMIMIK